jgi:hypothetical protein
MRHEKVVRGHLQNRNVEHFLPTIKRLNQWTDQEEGSRGSTVWVILVCKIGLGGVGWPCFNLRVSFDWLDTWDGLYLFLIMKSIR